MRWNSNEQKVIRMKISQVGEGGKYFIYLDYSTRGW